MRGRRPSVVVLRRRHAEGRRHTRAAAWRAAGDHRDRDCPPRRKSRGPSGHRRGRARFPIFGIDESRQLHAARSARTRRSRAPAPRGTPRRARARCTTSSASAADGTWRRASLTKRARCGASVSTRDRASIGFIPSLPETVWLPERSHEPRKAAAPPRCSSKRTRPPRRRPLQRKLETPSSCPSRPTEPPAMGGNLLVSRRRGFNRPLR